ncbi:1-aminocyclopropane-1-carboxylate synthase 2-like [Camellia sinensis]|uniref:1-aminocyclopropane-1-carboxylate synthase 2-like n=1 Tax=Camellia sinensis TaxID=4442 RepID=UPI001036AFCD|nr:1-aminocyclopropane-1-carboxylate synthase 2-like [Camellia sinensis]
MGLEEVEISCLPGNAGLFCWMDLRSLIKEPTFEDEMALWHVIIKEVKLNVSLRSSFHCVEPGWFRVCFTNMDDATVEVALRKIQTFVARTKKGEAPLKNKPWQRKLQLSFWSQTYNDGLIS